MKIFFYIPEKALNEATIYYTKIVEKAFLENDIKVIRVSDLNFSFDRKSDYIFTIRVIDYLKARIRCKTNRIIIWFQGILAEEHMMLNNYSFKSKIVNVVFNRCEKYVLKKAFFSFFVSKAMIQYFEKKHDIKIGSNQVVMPCYNKLINEGLFLSPKKELSFVYAGTLFSWQCFEETVEIFKEIEVLNSKAKFYIYTKEKETASIILKKYGVNNYELLFVSLEELDRELSQYEYGFLIRENHSINNVSTPTKMNSYLSVGLIPIYTDVILDFEQNLDLKEYSLKFDFSTSKKEIAIQVLQQKKINYPEYLAICKNNFLQYYDDEYNCKLITDKLITKIKNESTIRK